MTGAPNFVFVHGGGQGGWIWDETVEALRRQDAAASALALDLAGCGEKRGRDVSGLTSRDVAADAVEDLARSGLKEVVLVGHSNAGTVMPHMAALRPDLIRRMVYVSCMAAPAGRSVIQMLGTSRHGENDDEIGWPFDPKAAIGMEDRYRLMFCNDMEPAQTEAFLAKLGNDHWPTPAAVSEETDWRYDHLDAIASTYVVCLQDQILTPAWQERLAERLKCSRLVRLDAGHQAMNTRPHTLAEILLREAEAG
jgi:pimeloyl-ACP methyl ester carboxylesterase